MPRLPPTAVIKPLSLAICATSSVTVLLPLEPEIRTTGASTCSRNNSRSPSNSTPFSLAATKAGSFSEIPGLTIKRLYRQRNSASNSPVTISAFAYCFETAPKLGGSLRLSAISNAISCASKKAATERPVAPMPRIAVLRLVTIISAT